MSMLPREMDSMGPVPEVLFGYVSVRSQGGVSALDASRPESAEPFHATDDDRRQARQAVESIGLQVLAESRLGLSVAGPAGAYEEMTGGEVVTRERLVHAQAGLQRYVTHVDIVGSGQPEALGMGLVTSEAMRIEGVFLERPRIPQAVFPSPVPPAVQRFHLRVPDDVAVVLGAARAHRQGHHGAGVTVAMVDTGQYAHPFFAAHGYDVRPPVAVVPGTSPADDPVGHGTGESANVFAVAPAATLLPYRASSNRGQLVAAIGAFLQAKAERPDVLTNSWGSDGPFPPGGAPDEGDRLWGLEIRDAVEQGIVVVFAGGNGQFSIEPQVPGVLAAGGVTAGPGLDLSASNYASGYESPWFPGVTVPTACGLVGTLPRAQYLMLPIPPGCTIDVEESRPAVGQLPDPPDGTGANDGWALFSGTSAAAPQLAGATALILGAKPGLRPDQVVEALVRSAVDVRSGRCHPRFNQPAGLGPDAATGHGLVDAFGAITHAMGRFP